jgi:tetratricopeptide (TPR) repeat protein
MSPIQRLAAKALGFSLLVLFAVGAEADVTAVYGQAMSAYKSGNYEEALKDLDQLEPLDLKTSVRAESLNLRAVILMRKGDYEGAERTLQRTLDLSPLLANAKFNLAQVSFLKRDWLEARTRFEQMLVDDQPALESDTRQLIRFKVFLTLLLDQKKAEATKLMDEWLQTSPSAYYGHAAIEKDHGRGAEAKKWQQAARTKFGEATDKLYAESFYEIGWDARPANQQPEKFEIATAAERERRLDLGVKEVLAKTEDAIYAQSLGNARLLPASAEKNLPCRGALETLGINLSIDQASLTQTEIPISQALTDVPLVLEAIGSNDSKCSLDREQASQAREQLEKLFAVAKNRRSEQLILYKVFLTFILEGSDRQAELLMQRFSYTDETPAHYYAHAAWAFQHGDSASGNDWVGAAERIYSAELNALFVEDFYRLHWLDPNLHQIASTRVSLGAPASDSFPFRPPPPTIAASPATDSDPGPISQFVARTGESERP